MRALRATWEGLTCSFRYPHFMVGRQPSYPVPPPSTLYGLLAAARGGHFDPRDLRIAYAFTHGGTVDDLEHMHLTERASGQRDPQLGGHPKNLVANVNPVPREMFVFPRLALYLDVAEQAGWEQALRQPAYPVSLGRTQDLGSFVEVAWVDLERAPTGYVEGTITEAGVAERITQTVSLPSWTDPSDRARVVFTRYDVIREATPLSAQAGEGLWIDPTAPRRGERARAVVWLAPWREATAAPPTP